MVESIQLIENEVGGGHTTLLTDVMDLSSAPDPWIRYWAWYVNDGNSVVDDEWVVQITEDGGVEWVDLVRRDHSTQGWAMFTHRVADFVTPGPAVQLRFVAEDAGPGSIVEAAVDDFQVFPSAPSTDVAPEADHGPVVQLALHSNAPNPFVVSTTLRYSLPARASVDLRIFDVAGRLVRTLSPAAPQDAGRHEVRWDGTATGGRRVASGVYFARVSALGQSATRRLVRLE